MKGQMVKVGDLGDSDFNGPSYLLDVVITAIPMMRTSVSIQKMT